MFQSAHVKLTLLSSATRRPSAARSGKDSAGGEDTGCWEDCTAGRNNFINLSVDLCENTGTSFFT